MSRRLTFILVISMISICFVSISNSSVVDKEFIAIYRERKCHKGFTGEPDKIMNSARNYCKKKRITDYKCYKACLYDKAGIYFNGVYQKRVMNDMIDKMFHKSGANTAAKWKEESLKCAAKSHKKLEHKYPLKFRGDCRIMIKLEHCLASFKKCSKQG